MINFNSALEKTQNLAEKILSIKKTESINLFNLNNRILAQDILANTDLPPFNKSAVDGYACKLADILKPMKLLEIVPAGKIPKFSISTGECIKIMTGGVLPEGADTVLMIEYTTDENGFVKWNGDHTNANIIFKGQDLKTGDLILSKGTILGSQHIAVLASLGIESTEVYKKTKIAIIATGDEIIEPSEELEPAKIRNSNSYQLYSQILQIGAEPIYIGIAKDTVEDINLKFQEAIAKADVILLTGGVSMGDFDKVPEVLLKNSFTIEFDKVAIKPGKPTTLAYSSDKLVFGLPGNPVSCFAIFELFVKPAIYKALGARVKNENILMPIACNYKRKNAEREEFVPAEIICDKGISKILPLRYNGSSNIEAFANAKLLLNIPIGISEIKEGNIVNARFLQ